MSRSANSRHITERQPASAAAVRHLVVVLGDQLDATSAAFDRFDDGVDAILQMEVRAEATYIPQHKRRLAFFFVCIALGVGSVVALRSLVQNITQVVGNDAPRED